MEAKRDQIIRKGVKKVGPDPTTGKRPTNTSSSVKGKSKMMSESTLQKLPEKLPKSSVKSSAMSSKLKKKKVEPDSETIMNESIVSDPKLPAEPALTLSDENEYLQNEVSRLQDVLSTCRAERDEAVIKFNALSQRFEELLRHEHVEGQLGDSFERLQFYEENTERQAELVAKLQAKVQQYRERCQKLESMNQNTLSKMMEESQHELSVAVDRLQREGHERSIHLETAVINLQNETQRSASLMEEVKRLNSQLDESYSSNRSMALDVQKVTFELSRAHQELKTQQDSWESEIKANNELLHKEHIKLLALWKEIQSVKSKYSEMKTSSKADLLKLKQYFEEFTFCLKINCQQVEANYIISEDCDRPFDVVNKTPMGLWERIQELEANLFEKTEENNFVIEENKTLKSKLLNMKEELITYKKKFKDEKQNTSVMNEQLEDLNSKFSQYENMKKLVYSLQSHLVDLVQHVIQLADSQILNRHPEVKVVMSLKPGDMSFENYEIIKNTILGIFTDVSMQKSDVIDLLKKDIIVKNESAEKSSKEITELINSMRELEEQSDQSALKIDHLAIEKDMLVQEKESLKEQLANISKLQETVQLLEKQVSDAKLSKEELQKNFDELTISLESEKKLKQISIESIQHLKIEINQKDDSLESLKKEIENKDTKIESLVKEKDSLTIELSDLQNWKCQVINEKEDQFLTSLENTLREVENSKKLLLAEKFELEEEFKKVKSEKMNIYKEKLELSNEMSSLKHDLVYLEKECNVLNNLKDELTAMNSDLEEKNSQILQKYHDIENDRFQAADELEKVKLLNIELQESLQSLKQKIEQGQEIHNGTNLECIELKQKLTSTEVQLNTMRQKLEKLEDEHQVVLSEQQNLELSLYEVKTSLDVCESARDLQLKEIEGLTSQLATLRKEITQLQKENTTLHHEIRKSQQCNLELHTKLGSCKEQHQAEMELLLSEKTEDINRKINQITSLEEKMANLQRIADEKSDQLLKLKEQLRDRGDEYLYIEQIKLKIERELNGKTEELNLTRQDLSKLQSTLKDKEEGFKTVQEDYNKKMLENKNLQRQQASKISELTQKLKEFELKQSDEFDFFNMEKEKFNRINNHMKQQISKLKQQLKDSDERADELEFKLTSTKQELQKNEIELTKLTSKTGEFSHQVQKETELNVLLKSKNNELLEELSRRDSSCNSLKQQLSLLERDKNQITGSLTDEIIGLRKKCQDKDGLVFRLQSRTQELQNEINKLNDVLHELKAELDDVKDKNENLDRVISHRNTELEDIKKLLNSTILAKDKVEQELVLTRNRMNASQSSLEQKTSDLSIRIAELGSQKTNLGDRVRNLESQSAQKSDEIQRLEVKLKVEETKISALQRELHCVESDKRSLKSHIRKIVSFLYKYLGLKFDGTGGMYIRPPSPLMKGAQNKEEDKDIFEDSQVDSAMKSKFCHLSVTPEIIERGLQDFVNQLSQIKKERDNATLECQALKSSFLEYQEHVKKGETKLENIQEQLRQEINEKYNLQDKYAEIESFYQQKVKQLKETRDEKNTLQAELESSERKLDAITKKYDEVKKSLAQLENSESTVVKEVKLLKQSLSDAKIQLNDQKKSETDILEEKERLLLLSDQKIEELQIENENMKSEITSCKDLNQQLEQKLKEMNAALSFKELSHKDDLERFNKLFKITSSESTSVDRELQEANNKICELEIENGSYQRKISKLKQINEELQKRINVLIDQERNLQEELTNIQLCKPALEKHVHVLEKSIMSEKSLNRELKEKVTTLTEENQQLLDKISNFKEMIIDLQKKVRELESLRNQAERDREALRSRMENIEHKDSYSNLGSHYLANSESRLSNLSHGSQCSTSRSRQFRTSVENLELPQELRGIYCEMEATSRRKAKEAERNIEEIKKKMDRFQGEKLQYLKLSDRRRQEVFALSETLNNSLKRVTSNNLEGQKLNEETKKLSQTIENCIHQSSENQSHSSFHSIIDDPS